MTYYSNLYNYQAKKTPDEILEFFKTNTKRRSYFFFNSASIIAE